LLSPTQTNIKNEKQEKHKIARINHNRGILLEYVKIPKK
jgi:hypothetical protein